MTVGQHQKVEGLREAAIDQVERMAWAVCFAYNLSPEVVDNMTPKKFLKKYNQVEKMLHPRNSFFNPYRYQTDATKVTFGQFIECQTWLKNGSVAAMDQVAASIQKRRPKDHKAAAARIVNRNVRFVIGPVSKFIDSMNKLIHDYKGLFELLDGEEPAGAKKGHLFLKRYGWVYNAKVVADWEGIRLEDAYNLPIIRALNVLSILKAKAAYEKAVAGK